MEGMVYQIIDNKLESRENILSLHVQQFSSYSYCIIEPKVIKNKLEDFQALQA